MFNQIFLKLINVPVAVRTRLCPWFNRLVLRCHGVRYGRNVVIFNNFYIIGGGKITIGDDFMMTSDDCINPLSSNLRGAFYTEPGAVIEIGDRVGMSATRMWIRTRLRIANDVKIGAGVSIIDTDCHPIDWRLRAMRPKNEHEVNAIAQATKSAPITIEEHAWIGAGCIILKGVTIGVRSVIGAGSVVTRDIPADCIAAGNPAKVIKRLMDSTKKTDKRTL